MTGGLRHGYIDVFSISVCYRLERYKLAMIRKKRNQEEIPTQKKTEVGKTKLTIKVSHKYACLCILIYELQPILYIG